MEKKKMPLIPLRGLIVFPYLMLYFDVGRKKSVEALEEAMLRDQYIFLTTQKDIEVEEPSVEDFYSFGTIAKIKQMLKLPGDSIRVLVEGVSRGVITDFVKTEEYFEVQYQEIENPNEESTKEEQAYIRAINETFEKYSSLTKKIPQDIVFSLNSEKNPYRFCDMIAPQLGVSIEAKQSILEAVDVKLRLQRIYKYLLEEIEIAEVEKEINDRVKSQINKMQKEYFLREQIKVIQEELGDEADNLTESDKMLDKLKKISKREDYVVSWWDYGYPLRYYSDTKTLIDGLKHKGDVNFTPSAILTQSQFQEPIFPKPQQGRREQP